MHTHIRSQREGKTFPLMNVKFFPLFSQRVCVCSHLHAMQASLLCVAALLLLLPLSPSLPLISLFLSLRSLSHSPTVVSSLSLFLSRICAPSRSLVEIFSVHSAIYYRCAGEKLCVFYFGGKRRPLHHPRGA